METVSSWTQQGSCTDVIAHCSVELYKPKWGQTSTETADRDPAEMLLHVEVFRTFFQWYPPVCRLLNCWEPDICCLCTVFLSCWCVILGGLCHLKQSHPLNTRWPRNAKGKILAASFLGFWTKLQIYIPSTQKTPDILSPLDRMVSLSFCFV